MPQSFASIHVHAVFSTKHREPTIIPELRPRLHEYLGGIVRNDSNSLIAAGGTDDHLHLLISLGRTVAIADAMRLLRSNSSAWIHQEFPALQMFAWQSGYGAFAVSHSNIDAVKAYLARQEEHHRRQSFQEEFRELLRLHDLEWDERYAWD